MLTIFDIQDMLEDRFNKRMARARENARTGVHTGVERESIEWLSQFANGNGLDIACGDVLVPGAMGIDPNDRLGAYLGIVGSSGDALDGVDSGVMDYVVTNYPETFVAPLKAFREWHRVLKPGGTLAIICVDGDDPGYMKKHMGVLGNSRRKCCFTKNVLRYYLERCSFGEINMVNHQDTIRTHCKKI